jgi:hypothetical protein
MARTPATAAMRADILAAFGPKNCHGELNHAPLRVTARPQPPTAKTATKRPEQHEYRGTTAAAPAAPSKPLPARGTPARAALDEAADAVLLKVLGFAKVQRLRRIGVL